MKLSSKIKFSDAKIRDAFQKLPTSTNDEKKIYEWLLRAFKDIEDDAFCGIQIPKRLIPKEYKNKYKINNLWKYNLPNAWRLLYSIENREIFIVSIVLEWLDHKEYESRFKY